MDDLISRQRDCLKELMLKYGFTAPDMTVTEFVEDILPSAQPEPTLYGYPIEHLVMIARVMAKENCTPEDVVRMLQNAGEIAKMVRDEMMKMLKECVEKSCKGVANEVD